MKSKFLRMLALILVMSSLISMFAIFANAEETTESTEGETEGTEEELFTLLYNRHFGEGWNLDNGMELLDQGSTGSTTFNIEREGTNYFWRLELNSSDNDYAELNLGGNQETGTVFEFDVKRDVDCNFTNVISLSTKDGGTDLCFMKVENNKVYLMDGSEPAFELTESWTRIQVICDYTYVVHTDEEIAALPDVTFQEQARLENENTFRMYIYYSPANGSGRTVLYNNGPLEVVGASGKGIESIRFQSTEQDKPENYGSSICFDNIKAYDGTNELQTVTSEMGYGDLVDESKELDFDPEAGTGSSSSDLTTALSMKVGVDYCYINKEKMAIATADDGTVYGAPVRVNGVVMIPLNKVLEYTGYEFSVQPDGKTIAISPLPSEDGSASSGTSFNIVIGENTAAVGANNISLTAAPGYVTDENNNSYVVIALDDVGRLFSGYYSDYDEMGFMTVSKSRNMIDRNSNLNNMVSVMKAFVFEYYTPESIYNDVKANTNDFQHPYILANGDQLEALYDEYQEYNAKYLAGTLDESSDEYWMWVHYQGIVKTGENYYKYYAKKDSNGTYDTFVGVLTDEEYEENNGASRGNASLSQDNLKTQGYDENGHSGIANRTARLESLAYAYVLTKDVKYLQLSYEIALILGGWTHWGPNHFIECADASSDFAIYYDWTYNGYVELAAKGVTRPDGSAYDVAALADILVKKGVHVGYDFTSKGSSHIIPKANSEDGSYTVAANVSGMTLAALAILGDVSETYVTEATTMLSKNFQTLVDKGLSCYAPDGSYIEGPSNWSIGTNSLFRMAAALDSAAGKNYGIMDCWGIDSTCYYALHTEDNDSNYFPFHEGSAGSQDTSYFFYVADYFGDAALYDIRLNQINGSVKRATLIDMLYYPRDLDLEAEEIQLDYYSDGVDLFATRSSWEKGALYASMIGGSNSVTHGQIDAGSFVYHNGGNVWICDLGTENYNVPGIWPSATRYRYYVMKPEGNNTVAITTDPTGVPYGQLLNASAKMKAWGSNEHGSYVVYDMGKTLGAEVNSWERGMLLTNDRKTTVIQDKIAFQSFQKIYWFAHYSKTNVDSVKISEDGRTAYMRQYLGKDEHGEKIYQTLRLSIVSSNQTFKFELMDTYTFLHTTEAGVTSTNTTYTPEAVSQLGGERENSRQKFMKLAIASGDVLEFKVAVVIELIDDSTVGKKTEIDVGYSYVENMAQDWEPAADTRGLKIDTGDTIIRRGVPNVDKHFVQSLLKIGVMEEQGVLYTEKVEDYYRALTDAYYVVKTLGRDMPSEYNDQKAVLTEYREAFTAYRKAITNLQKDQLEFVYKLLGLK